MLTTEERQLRSRGVGASEVSSIVGLNPWSNRYDIYCKKRGLVEDDEHQSLQVRVGHLCEDLSAGLYCEQMQCELERCTTTVHPEHEWALSTPDRTVVGNGRLVEIKFVGWRVAHHWENDDEGVPPYVRAQVEWQMFTTGQTRCDVAALIAGEDFRIYPIERNEALQKELFDRVRAFWFDHVVPGVPPPVDDSESARNMLEALFKKTRPELVPATASVEFWVDKFIEAQADEKDVKRRKLEASNKIREFIGEAEGLLSSRGKFYCKRSDGDERRSLRFYAKKEKAA